MRIRSLQSAQGAKLRYGLAAALVVALFGVGFVIGNLADSLLRSEPQTSDVRSSSGGAVVEPPHLLQDFTLTSHTGDPISLSDLRGRVVLFFFGYTHCPDVCPTTLASYTRVKAALGENADEVAFAFISVDGTRDTPDEVAEYLGRFDPDFIGMTGDEQTVQRIGQEYGLFFQQQTEFEHQHEDGQLHVHQLGQDEYLIGHTSPSFLVDREGYLRVVYFYGTEPDVIAAGIRDML